MIMQRFRWPLWYVTRFVAGFCLVANGAYITSGPWLAAGDTADLLRLGVPQWVLPLSGLPPLAAGLALWQGLGQYYGLSRRPHSIPLSAPALTLLILLVVLTTLSLGS
jgi:hypothetical protein